MRFLSVPFLIVGFLLFAIGAMASPNLLTYQGRILKSDGTPLEYSSVSFIFQIVDPSGQCVIYQENVNGINMVNSGGVFDVPIGGGTVKYPLTGTFKILDAFNNASSFSCGDCSSGSCVDGSSTYNGVAGDTRLLRVQFYDGSGWKTISPDNVIRSVPFAGYALSAQKLGNNVASDFLTKVGLPTCGANTFLSWNGTTLSCQAVSGSAGGTVTSVTVGAGLTGGTITSSGTIGLGTELTGLNSLASTGFVKRTGAGAYSTATISLTSDVSGVLPAANGGTGMSSLGVPNQVLGVNNTGTAAEYKTITAGTGITVAHSAGAITINATGGNAITALTGDVTASGPGSVAATIASVGGVSAANIASGATAANSATSANTASTLVSRDASGNFSAGTITANLTGSVTGAASLNVLKTGDTMTGTLNLPANGLVVGTSQIVASGGKVGIGTASPTGTLDVVDNTNQVIAKFEGNPTGVNQGVILTLDNYNTTAPAGSSLDIAAVSINTKKSSGNSGGINLYSLGQNYSGNLGAASEAVVYASNYTTGLNLNNYSATGDIRFTRGATEYLRIKQNGNIGIKTAAPATVLHLGAAPSTTANYPLFALGSGPFDGSTSGFFTGSGSGTFIGVNEVSGYAGDFLNFQINGVTKYKIDNSGNITTGGTTSSTGTISTTGNISTTGTGTITSAGALIASSGAASTSPTTGSLIVTGGAGISGALNVGSNVIANGNISASAATAAIAGTNQSSPSIYLTANYWNGSASAVDQWSIQNILGTGTNPTSTLTFGHSGSSGSASYAFLNGNVGIGTTTPVAGLQVKGTAIIGNDAANKVNVSINTGGPANTRNLAIWYNSGGTDGSLAGDYGVIQAVYGGVGYSSLALNPLGGNVGIGTSSPVGKLSVQDSGVPGIQIKTTGAGAVDTFNLINDSNASGQFWIAKGATANAAPAAADKLVNITNEGNVEIYGQAVTAGNDKSGVLALKTEASAVGGTRNEVSMEFYADKSDINTMSGYIGYESNPAFDLTLSNEKAGNLILNTSATERMRIDSSGNVGIGGISSGSKLFVNNNTGTVFDRTLQLRNGSFNNIFIGHSSGIAHFGTNDLALAFHTVSDTGVIGTSTPTNERMRITSTGNVGIGLTSPSFKLDVNGNTQIRGSIGAKSSTDNSQIYLSYSESAIPELQANQSNGSAAGPLAINPLGGNVGIGTAAPAYKLDVQGGDINASGSVRAAGVALTSDVRFKKNIQTLDRALEKILRIRGVTYQWRTEEFPERHFNDRSQIGVIAQEVEKEFPEAVDTNPDGYKAVNYPSLVSPLIEATKELYGMCRQSQAHEGRISQLEKENEQIKRDLASVKEKADKAEKENEILKSYLCKKDPSAPFCR